MKEYLQVFKPKLIVKDIYDIDFKALRGKKINALILDIDDTLIPRKVNDIYPSVSDWVISRKEEGFKLCLVSNSRHPLRVKYIGDTLGVAGMPFGLKPLPFAFWRAMDVLKSMPGTTAMIGDQLFMDILGANLLNIYSIYVKHLTEETFILRQWMRLAENWVIDNLK